MNAAVHAERIPCPHVGVFGEEDALGQEGQLGPKQVAQRRQLGGFAADEHEVAIEGLDHLGHRAE